jgi:type I restriction enzyme M protein
MPRVLSAFCAQQVYGELIMAKIGEFFLIRPEDWLYQTHGDVIAARARAEEYERLHDSLDRGEYQIEEFVRQWALRQLIDVYGYPREWLGERITIEEPVRMGAGTKEADIALKNKSRRVFLYIETKHRGRREVDFIEDEGQLESYLSSTHTATIGMITDGDRVKCIRKKIDPNDFDYIPDIPSYGVEASQRALLVREIPTVATGQRKTGLQPITERYERRLFEAHSAIRDVDGLHDDEALDELAKVLYTKIYDEGNTCEQPEGTPFRFQVFGASNPSEAASLIREVYDEARKKDVEIYSKRIPNYERSRGVFKVNIRLSDNALYRVVELLQEFSLIDSPTDIKGRAFQKVLGPAIRAGMGQYFTPDPVVDMAVKIARPKPSDLILDPFCGSGHFLTRCLDYVVQTYSGKVPDHDLYKFKFFHLHGIEKSERMVRIAMTDMMLHDDGHTNIRNTDALLSFDNYPDIIALREDDQSDPAIFDLILTNPPFGSIMKSEVMEMLGRFTLGHKRKSLPLEVMGLERCFQFLKPKGRLGIVLPDGLLKNKNGLFVRRWIESLAEIKAVISLPIETFSPYGAAIKTSLCFFQKSTDRNKPKPTAKVFLAEVHNLGYDATGRLNNNSEVDAVVAAFHDQVGWQI